MTTSNFFSALRRSGLALCLLLLFLTSAAAAPAPLAILTEVRGVVAVLRGGKSVAGKDGTQLFRGDVVRVSRGAATVYSVTRAPQTLHVGQQLRVGAVGKAAAPSVWRGAVALLASGFESRKLTKAGVVRDPLNDKTAPPLLISPANTKIESARPRFVWADPAAQLFAALTQDYRVVVSDSGREMWSGLSAKRALQYPAAAPPLVAGREYSWRVEPRAKSRNGGEPQIAIERLSANATFRVATPQEIKAAREEAARLASETKTLPPSQRALAGAGAWSARGFAARALEVLAPQLGTESGADDALKTLVFAAAPDENIGAVLRALLSRNAILTARFEDADTKNGALRLVTREFQDTETTRKTLPKDSPQLLEATENAAASASKLAWVLVDAAQPESAMWFTRSWELQSAARALLLQKQGAEIAEADAEIAKIHAAVEAAPPAQKPLLAMQEESARITRDLQISLRAQAQLLGLNEEMAEGDGEKAPSAAQREAPQVALAAFNAAASTREKAVPATQQYAFATRATSSAASRVAWSYFDDRDSTNAGEWFARAAGYRRESLSGFLAWQENALREDEARGAAATRNWNDYGASSDEPLRAQIAGWKRVLAAQDGTTRQNIATQLIHENSAKFDKAPPAERTEILRRGAALNALTGLATRLEMERAIHKQRRDLMLRAATENNDSAARLRYAQLALDAARAFQDEAKQRETAPDSELSQGARQNAIEALFDLASAQSEAVKFDDVQATLDEARAQIALLPADKQLTPLASLEGDLGNLEDKKGAPQLALAHLDTSLELMARGALESEKAMNVQILAIQKMLKSGNEKTSDSTLDFALSRFQDMSLMSKVTTVASSTSTLISAALIADQMDDEKAFASYIARAENGLAPLQNRASLPPWLRGSLRDLSGLVQQVKANGLASQGDIDGALKLMERVVALRRARGRDEYTALALRNTGKLLDESGDAAGARDYLTQAQRIFAATENAAGFASSTLFLGRLARDAGDVTGAENAANLTLANARNLKNKPFISAGAQLLAEVRLAQNNPAAANELLDEAQAANAGGESALDRAALLDLRARVLAARGDNEAALQSYQDAVAQIETVRAATLSPANFSNLRSVYKTYERLVALLLKMNRADEAFDYLSRARSKKLQDSMRLSAIQSDDPKLKTLLQRASALENQLRDVDGQIADERAQPDAAKNPARLANLTRVAASTRGEFSQVALQIRDANPNFDQILTVSPTLLKNAQKRLPEGAILLQYAPLGDAIYVFVVTRENLKIVQLASTRNELWERIREFRTLMEGASRRVSAGENASGSAADEAALETNLTTLYAMLLEPLREEIAPKRVVAFVPSGLLYYLPMHALAHRAASTRAGEKAPLTYFIEEKAVSYLVQSDVLALVLAPVENGAARGMTAVGDPAGADLPDSLQEVQGIARVYPATTVLSGAAATVGAVKDEKNLSRRILHFATHSVLNAGAPLQSYIQLAQPKGAKTSPSDANLTLGEVAGLDLASVDLVTLSACRTALGERDPEGREITSLAQAFSTAGAKSIVASLWSVSDASTKTLMVDFYTRLAAGEDKAGALRNAMIKMRRDPQHAHPFYWAPFDLMGDWR